MKKYCCIPYRVIKADFHHLKKLHIINNFVLDQLRTSGNVKSYAYGNCVSNDQ